MDLTQYKTLVFDCDGVILDSNRIKTQAFYHAALPYGETIAKSLVQYHTSAGGVSRYEKFRKFLADMVPPGKEGPGYDELLLSYAGYVKEGLISCEIADKLSELRELTRSQKWMIVSGGDQNEINKALSVRDISGHFDGGIFGSPDDKKTIINREIANKNIIMPALYFGDSRYDHLIAMEHGLDFMFVHKWTEFEAWKEYCKINNITCISMLSDLLQDKDGSE